MRPTSLGNCRQLISFNLGTFQHWTDDNVSRLANLSHLETLRISGPEVTDVGLNALAGLTALRQLDIDDVSATGAGLRHLAEFPELRHLSFSSKQANDAVIPNILRCAKLSRLSLTGNGITDRGVGLLRNMQQLRDIYLASPTITDAGMASLSGLRKLQRLTLVSNAITSAGVAHLKDLPDLKDLHLTETHVDGSVLKVLPAFKSLQRVSLPAGAVTVREVQPLVDQDLAISIGWKQLEKTAVAARNNLIKEAVRKRWAAQRIEDAAKCRESLIALEINESDLVKIFGAKVAHAIWPVYFKPWQKTSSSATVNNPSNQEVKLIDVSVWPATSWGTGDVSREIIAIFRRAMTTIRLTPFTKGRRQDNRSHTTGII